MGRGLKVDPPCVCQCNVGFPLYDGGEQHSSSSDCTVFGVVTSQLQLIFFFCTLVVKEEEGQKSGVIF